jgi:TRAP-type transport system periplasmic protein
MNQIAKLFVAALIALAVVSPSSAQRVLKINESLGPGSPEEMALERFKELVEEGSSGELAIQIHLLDALGKPDVALESLMTGSLELYSGALEYYSTIVGPEINVISLPYFIGTHDKLRAYLKSEAFQPALDKLLENGVRVLSTEWNADRGPYRVLVTAKPVREVDDIEGLKVRMFPNDVYQRSWAALGAVPVQLAWTETYLGIRQGTVDAVTSPLSLVRSMKFSEVAPYIVEIKEYPQTWPITISERVWQTLTPEQQQLLVDSANEAGRLYAETTMERAQQDIEAMKAENDAEVIEIDRDAMRAKLSGLYEELANEGVVPASLIEAVNALN